MKNFLDLFLNNKTIRDTEINFANKIATSPGETKNHTANTTSTGGCRTGTTEINQSGNVEKINVVVEDCFVSLVGRAVKSDDLVKKLLDSR